MSKHVELGNLVRRISHMYIQPHKDARFGLYYIKDDNDTSEIKTYNLVNDFIVAQNCLFCIVIFYIRRNFGKANYCV